MIPLTELCLRRRWALGLVTLLSAAFVCAPWYRDIRWRRSSSADERASRSQSEMLRPKHKLLSRRVIFDPPRQSERVARDPRPTITPPDDPDDLLHGQEDLLWNEIIGEDAPSATTAETDDQGEASAPPPTRPPLTDPNDSRSSMDPPALPAPPSGAPMLEVPVEPATVPDSDDASPREHRRDQDDEMRSSSGDKKDASTDANLDRFDALIQEADQVLEGFAGDDPNAPSSPPSAEVESTSPTQPPIPPSATSIEHDVGDEYLIDPADDLLHPAGPPPPTPTDMRSGGDEPVGPGPPQSSNGWQYQSDVEQTDQGVHGPPVPPPTTPETLPVPSPQPAIQSPRGFGRSPAMPAPHGKTTAKREGDEDPHRELFAKNHYPSAKECAKCHKKIYDEWSGSSHAYAAISPMFHRFEQKINDLSQGTIGYFCYRCHAPIATNMYATRATPLWELSQVEREGVTCIVCHRVNERYGKVNGERHVLKGDIYAPVFGGIGGDGVAEVVARKDHYKVKTSPEEKGPGQPMHSAGLFFEQITQSEFCVSCHQVAVHPNIKLEVVWEQYRASPARKKGIRCQDCHMGRVPGVASGFETGPAAEMEGKAVCQTRKHSNHVFYGPGYSIAHPGIFPHHLKADRWSMDEWLQFDWRAGWGTDEFEDRVARGELPDQFPPVWAEVDDRYDAREIVEENLKKLSHKRELRRQVLENGSQVDGPFFIERPTCGEDLVFNYLVTNTNEGHNLPSGSLGAQPQLWANVVLIGPEGRRLWESGYTDSWGDVADIHSQDVRNKRIPFDWQLFNLQTMFLITGAKGTDREFFLPINVDIDQLPFIRPANIPTTVTNHPPFIRMEGRSLSPLGSRRVKYRVPSHLIQRPGRYRLAFRMRSRAEPIYFMRFCGATTEMQRAMNEWMVDVHPNSVEFYVHPAAPR